MTRLLTTIVPLTLLMAANPVWSGEASPRKPRTSRTTSIKKENPKSDVAAQSGIAWHTTPEGAAAAASKSGHELPILWFRHVGELTGPMCSASHRMRVVSFAEPETRRQLEGRFVPLSTNMEGLPGSGKSVGHLPSDAPGMCPPRLAHQNCQVYFLTPKLEMFHAATGFLSTPDLVREMQFADDLFKSLQKRPREARQTVVAAHLANLKRQGFTEQELAPPSDGLGKLMADTGMDLPSFGKTSPDDIFSGFERSRVLRDNQYLTRYPLISLAEFERDPTPLVGAASFAFQSGNASGRPTGK